MELLLQAIIFGIVIFLGVRLHGIGIGIMGCLGLLLITILFGIEPVDPPFKLMLMMMAATIAAANLEVSGTLDLLSRWASRFFVYHTHMFVWVSALLTYLIVFLLGTSHIMYAIFPVLVRISKKGGLPPVRPLVASTLAAELAVLASPSSAQSEIILDFFGQGAQQSSLAILIPATLAGTLVATLVASRQGKDPGYCMIGHLHQPRVKNPLLARGSIALFLGAIVFIMIGGRFLPKGVKPIYFKSIVLMSVAAMIALFAGTEKIVHTHVFQVGMQSVVALCGIAWLSSTLLTHHQEGFRHFAAQYLNEPWQWMILLFSVTTITGSQAATLQMLLNEHIMQASSAFLYVIPAVNSFYVLPSAPLVLAAMSIDDTGSTHMGSYFINHSFFVAGIFGTLTSLGVAKLIALWVL